MLEISGFSKVVDKLLTCQNEGWPLLATSSRPIYSGRKRGRPISSGRERGRLGLCPHQRPVPLHRRLCPMSPYPCPHTRTPSQKPCAHHQENPAYGRARLKISLVYQVFRNISDQQQELLNQAYSQEKIIGGPGGLQGCPNISGFSPVGGIEVGMEDFPKFISPSFLFHFSCGEHFLLQERHRDGGFSHFFHKLIVVYSLLLS